jgi:hypothetical protein
VIDVFSEGFAGRPAGDILSRVVRVSLGGQTYELPVRSIKANREWKAGLNARTAAFIGGLEAAGEDFEAIFGQLAGQVDPLLDMLLSYDTAGVLPTREAIEDIEPDASQDIVDAVREVWRAANPLVATTMKTLMEAIEISDSSPPTSTPPPPTATARRRKSKTT